MYEVPGVIESAGFAKEEVFPVLIEFQITDAAEPNQFHHMIAVAKLCAEALPFAYADGMPFEQAPADLYRCVLVSDIRYVIHAAAVGIAEGVVAEQIHGGLGMELMTKNVGTFRTDILAIGYVSYIQVGHRRPG